MLAAMRSRVSRLVLALVAVLAAGPASAQAIPTPPAAPITAADAATAKKAFESGLKLLAEGASAEALIAFESSYKLGGRPSALRNLAQCHRNVRHMVEAYEAYEQLLALHDAQLSAADRSTVRLALDELGFLTRPLTVQVNEPGALVEVDGRPIGTTPLARPKRVLVGEHKVRVSKAGFEPVDKPLNAASGADARLEITLEAEKLTGHVTVREPRGRDVRVYVDGAERGAAPWEGELSAGEHNVEVRGTKFGSEARSVRVAAKDRLDLALEATALEGHLRIATAAGAVIELDGRSVGAGTWEGDVPPGTHMLRVTLAGAAPVVREVRVSRGETVAQEISVGVAGGGGGEPAPDYTGLFVRLSATPLFSLSGLPENAAGGATTDSSFHLALGTAVRLGWSFDPFAVELVGSFMFEHQDQQLALPAPYKGYSMRFESNGPDAFVGVGGRVTSRDPSVRLTAGFAPGISYRKFPVNRHDESNGCGSSNGSSLQLPSPCNANGNGDYSFSASYTTFGMMADAGILFGSSPGSKFFLGLNAFVDFAPADVVVGPDPRPPPAYQASPGSGLKVLGAGAQLLVGPVLGVQFGH
jgi:hypothetical protein